MSQSPIGSRTARPQHVFTFVVPASAGPFPFASFRVIRGPPSQPHRTAQIPPRPRLRSMASERPFVRLIQTSSDLFSFVPFVALCLNPAPVTGALNSVSLLLRVTTSFRPMFTGFVTGVTDVTGFQEGV